MKTLKVSRTLLASSLALSLFLVGCAQEEEPTTDPTETTPTASPTTSVPTDDPFPFTNQELCQIIIEAYPQTKGSQLISEDDYNLGHILLGEDAPDCVYNIGDPDDQIPTHRALYLHAERDTFESIQSVLLSSGFSIPAAKPGEDANILPGVFARMLPTDTVGELLLTFYLDSDALVSLANEVLLQDFTYVELDSSFDKDFVFGGDGGYPGDNQGNEGGN